mmetsp:Transcript_18820/g.42949  ORF Transcript_18820/g.42949 Transcript_18820/m.42949 type:complete len:85 (-) Transcript_18820:92-346(-)
MSIRMVVRMITLNLVQHYRIVFAISKIKGRKHYLEEIISGHLWQIKRQINKCKEDPSNVGSQACANMRGEECNGNSFYSANRAL